MPAFLEERFPVHFEYGASFKQKHAVQIQTTQSGAEFRRLLHPFVRLDYQVSFKDIEADIMSEVVSFYQRTNGSYRGFRVRDLADYSTNDFKGVPTSSDMKMIPCDEDGVILSASQIATGYTHAFYVRWYGDQTDTECSRRYLKKINDDNHDPVLSYYDGVSIYTDLVIDTDFTVDVDTGIITLAVARTDDDLYGGCEFDIPCRFDDEPNNAFSQYDILTVSGISIIEIFNP